MRRSYTWRTFGRELTLLAIAAIWCIPFYLLVTISFKQDLEVFESPAGLPKSIHSDNFRAAWEGTQGLTLGNALMNSVLITVGTIIALILLGSVAAYAMVRRPGKLSNTLYVVFVLGIILPYQLAIVPSYVLLRQIGLVGNQIGLIVLYTGFLMPLTVFLYTSFVRMLPIDYEMAAQVDGATRFYAFRRVVFPLLRPITGTVAILAGLIVWNDFFIQLIFLSGTRNQTLPVAVYSFVGEFAARWNLVFAAVIVSLIPILAFYVLAQKQLIRGFSGGIKS